MKTVTNQLAGLLLSTLAFGAQAESYSSHIAYHNDVAYHSMTITKPGSSLVVWTDSYINGANFDPIINVWHNNVRVGQNDDNSSIDPANQTIYDSGIRLSNLAVGTYVFTVSAFANFSVGANIGLGFVNDGQTPIPLDSWCQLASHCDMAKHFSLHWTVN